MQVSTTRNYIDFNGQRIYPKGVGFSIHQTYPHNAPSFKHLNIDSATYKFLQYLHTAGPKTMTEMKKHFHRNWSMLYVLNAFGFTDIANPEKVKTVTTIHTYELYTGYKHTAKISKLRTRGAKHAITPRGIELLKQIEDKAPLYETLKHIKRYCNRACCAEEIALTLTLRGEDAFNFESHKKVLRRIIETHPEVASSIRPAKIRKWIYMPGN